MGDFPKKVFRRPTLTNGSTVPKPSDFAVRDAFISEISKLITSHSNEFSFLNLNSQKRKLDDEPSRLVKKSIQGIRFNHQNTPKPASWSPTLILPSTEELNTQQLQSVTLATLEIFPLRPSPQTFILESTYTIEKVLPRSFFGILYQCNISHTFVFNLNNIESLFFKELTGMRQSTYVNFVETNTDEKWELHLKPSKGVIFGYLCKPADLNAIIQDHSLLLLKNRKLPLVLDLDDTLVRVVGNAPGRYVPEDQIKNVMHRVRDLKDGRKVVLAERVHEFLAWASQLFDISVCSLGDQPYVDMVAQILNSETPIIKGGVAYSARGEYLYISQHSKNPRKPPKDLRSLFAFYGNENTDKTVIPLDPLILDDNAHMWPEDQQDNIIVIREMTSSHVWNVALFPVVRQALSYIHEGFFRAVDAWQVADHRTRGPPPSSLTFYKEYMRKELSNRIAEHQE